MIVTRHGFKKRYSYGSGLFDTIANFLTRFLRVGQLNKLHLLPLMWGKV